MRNREGKIEGEEGRRKNCNDYSAAIVQEIGFGLIGRRAARCFSFY